MAPLRLSNSKILLCVLGLLLFGSSPGACAQVQWDCMPLHFNFQTRALYVDSTDSSLYVVGTFDTVNGVEQRRLVKMRPDGTISPLPHCGISPTCVIRWNGKLYAGGFVGLKEYDGSSWRTIDSTGAVFEFYPYQGKLLVGGAFDDVPGNSDVESVLKEWDGTTLINFKGLDSALTTYAVNAMVEYQGDLIVAGNLTPYAPANPLFKDLLRWTGTSWQPLGNVGLPGGGLDFVSDMKVINGELYVAGYFQEGGGSPGNCIAKWDGMQWHRLGNGIATGGINDMLVVRDTLVIAGTFSKAGDDTAYRITRYWDGHWCGNKTRFPDVIVSAFDYYGSIVTTGRFSSGGADTCGYLAKVTS